MLGTNFGYSLAMQSAGASHWVLVGAPLSNVTLVDSSVGVRWGKLYNCTLDKQVNQRFTNVLPRKSNTAVRTTVKVILQCAAVKVIIQYGKGNTAVG